MRIAAALSPASVFLGREWNSWPADPRGELERWAERGVDRIHVSMGCDDMERRLELLAEVAAALATQPARDARAAVAHL